MNKPRVIVIGSGAGGAAAARELQGPCNVTILEAGRKFSPLSMSLRWMERLRNWGFLVNERIIQLVFPPMNVRKARDKMVVVNGMTTGGTTVLSAGNALRMDEDLRRLGINLDREFAELSREVPASTAHQGRWSAATKQLFQISRDMGLAPTPTPKLVDFSRCRCCGRCVLGCPYGAKWDSRRFLNEAVANGAVLRCGWRVTKVVISGGRAIGVVVKAGIHKKFLPADLVILAAGGIGTPIILERSGIRCEPQLFVDPVLCVAAPWPGSMQHHEIPMPFVIQRPGYIISPYFDYLSFLFNRNWRYRASRVLGLMIKLADTEQGSVRGARIDKGLTSQDRERLAEAETLCRRILEGIGADPSAIFTGTLNAGHPGGMLPLTKADAETLHPERLPQNLYVADASLLPKSLGNPPILTILALARKVARTALEAILSRESFPRMITWGRQRTGSPDKNEIPTSSEKQQTNGKPEKGARTMKPSFFPNTILKRVAAIMTVTLGFGSLLAKELNENKLVPLDAVREIQVIMSAEPVSVIRTEPGNDIRFRLYGKSMQEIHLGSEMQNMTVTVETKRKHSFPMPEDLALDIYLPENYKNCLSIKTSSGSVRLESVDLENISLQTSSGELDAGELHAGKIGITTSSGKIKIQKIVAQELTIKGTSSPVAIDECTAAESRIETSSGGIILKTSRGNLNVKTKSGSVKIHCTEFDSRSIRIATTSGHVSVGLPAAAEFQVRAKTGSGKFQTDFPVITTGTVDSKKIEGRVGTENNYIEIQTSSGSMKILKSN